MTPPPPCFTIWRWAHLQPRNTPVRLMPTTAFQPFTEMSSGRARKEAPALLTMTSRRPNWRAAWSTIACTCSSTRTSTTVAKDRRPRSWMALATGSRCSILRLQIATSARARPNSRAMDLPMPVPPPVTMAVLPSSENGERAMRGTILQGACSCRAPACSSGGFAAATESWGEASEGGRSPPPRKLAWKRDLGLADGHLALDPPPEGPDLERGAVVAGARRELVHERPGLTEPAPGHLGRAAHAVVAGGLRLHPCLLDVGEEEDELIDLTVDVGLPAGWRGEVRTTVAEHDVEVVGDLAGVADVVIHAGLDLGGRTVPGRPCRRPERSQREQGEEQDPHRSQYTWAGQAAAGRTATSSRSRRSTSAQSMFRKNASTYFFRSVAL